MPLPVLLSLAAQGLPTGQGHRPHTPHSPATSEPHSPATSEPPFTKAQQRALIATVKSAFKESRQHKRPRSRCHRSPTISSPSDSDPKGHSSHTAWPIPNINTAALAAHHPLACPVVPSHLVPALNHLLLTAASTILLMHRISPYSMPLLTTPSRSATPWVGELMAKVDQKNAFRLCPVRPEDWHLLGIHWQGKYYIDKCLHLVCN